MGVNPSASYKTPVVLLEEQCTVKGYSVIEEINNLRKTIKKE